MKVSKNVLKKIVQKALTHGKLRCEWPLWLRINRISAEYNNMQGEKLNLKNPRLFTEKIQWYKLFYTNELMHECADKVRFKEYVKKRLGNGYTAKLFGAWNNIEDLERDWSELPNTFCIKSNLSADGNAIEIVKDKSTFDFDSFLKEATEWLKPENTALNWYSSAYYSNTPMILAEEYLNLAIEGSLDDYKVFCFNGEPRYIYVASEQLDGVKEHKYITFYTLDWKRLDIQYGSFYGCDNKKPKHLEDMISIARVLSKDFPFVRVDFYDLPNRLLLGEMTFDPAGGYKKIMPVSYNLELGKFFVLPPPNVKMSKQIKRKYFNK